MPHNNYKQMLERQIKEEMKRIPRPDKQMFERMLLEQYPHCASDYELMRRLVAYKSRVVSTRRRLGLPPPSSLTQVERDRRAAYVFKLLSI